MDQVTLVKLHVIKYSYIASAINTDVEAYINWYYNVSLAKPWFSERKKIHFEDRGSADEQTILLDNDPSFYNCVRSSARWDYYDQ